MSRQDEGYIGYRDEIDVHFTAITNSYIPKLELLSETKKVFVGYLKIHIPSDKI